MERGTTLRLLTAAASLGLLASANAVSPAEKIVAPLDAIVASSGRQAPVDVVLYLVRQPAPVIAREVRNRHKAEMRSMTDQVRLIVRLAQPPGHGMQQPDTPLPPIVSGEMAMWHRSVALQADALRDRMKREVVAELLPAVAGDHAAMRAYVERLGGRVNSTTSVMSTVAATVPAGSVFELAKHPNICWVTWDHPGEPELDVQKVSLGLTGGFWLNGFTGGVFDAGVLDTGVFQAHPAFANHRFESNAGVGDNNGHGTGIAGIMASHNTTFTGMAPGLDTIAVAIAGNDSTSMNGMNWLVTGTVETPENVNYSFGNGTATGNDYAPIDQFFDSVISSFGIMVSKSTGNGGWSSSSLTITRPAPAYNLLAVANMDDQNTIPRADDLITSSSSRGPTSGGRKKPDISAPGTNSLTTNRTGGFSNLGGTSSAAPNVGGGVILLNNLGILEATATKAILINSAQAWADNNTSSASQHHPVNGSHWNRTFGWGYLDLGKAFAEGLNVHVVDMPAPSPGGRNYRLFKGTMQQWDKATLTWHRHVAFAGAMYPNNISSFSNLNLALYRSNDGSLAFSSTSAIDSVEQVHAPTALSGVLKVYTTGTFDPAISEEEFALATTGPFVAASGPQLSVAMSHPNPVAPGQEFTLTAQVTNTGDLPAHAATASISGMTIVSGASPQSLGVIPAGEMRQATWTVRASETLNQETVTVNSASSSYGEVFTGSANSTVNISAAILPTQYQLFRGILVDGVLPNVYASNDQYLRVRPGLVLSSMEAPVQVVLTGQAPAQTPGTMKFKLEAGVSGANLTQKIELFNYSSSLWVAFDTRPATTADSVVEVTVPTPSQYIEAGTRNVSARLSWRQAAPMLSFPWTARIDQAVWPTQ